MRQLVRLFEDERRSVRLSAADATLLVRTSSGRFAVHYRGPGQFRIPASS
jgi:hypothetical protein